MLLHSPAFYFNFLTLITGKKVMQPKRITSQRALNQRPETRYKTTATNISSIHAPFREVTQGFGNQEFAGADFIPEEFGSDLSTMDYGPPDFVDQRFLRLITATSLNGHRSASTRAVYHLTKRGVDVVASLILLVLASPLLAAIALLVKASSNGPSVFRAPASGI